MYLDNDKIMVSVCVQTYQHVDYIRQCLDNLLAQQTDFLYEIILGEDESIDGTREICIEYAKKYPNKIKLFLRSRKDVIYINGLPTGRFNFFENLKQSKGKYIALCEGDDYWSDSLKLQKQVDFLEKNQDFVFTGHLVEIFNQQNQTLTKPQPPSKNVFLLEDVVLNPPVYTSSCLFKSDSVKGLKFPKKMPAGDDFLMCYILKQGKGFVFHEYMSVYRISSVGTWSNLSNQTKQYKVLLIQLWILISFRVLVDRQLLKIKNLTVSLVKKKYPFKLRDFNLIMIAVLIVANIYGLTKKVFKRNF